MAFRLFLDINIILDFFDRNRAGYQDAEFLFDEAQNFHIICYLSESVLDTTAYISLKRIRQSTVLTMFEHMLSFIQILPMSNSIYLAAINASKNDLEDSVLYQLALVNQVDYFITNNIKDLRKLEKPSLPVKTPKEIIDLLQKL